MKPFRILPAVILAAFTALPALAEPGSHYERYRDIQVRAALSAKRPDPIQMHGPASSVRVYRASQPGEASLCSYVSNGVAIMSPGACPGPRAAELAGAPSAATAPCNSRKFQPLVNHPVSQRIDKVRIFAGPQRCH